MRIDSAGQHVLPGRVDLMLAAHRTAKLHDDPATDADIGHRFEAARYDRAVADNEIHHG